MKILNLYAGIGGNRKLWPEGHDITAVEYDDNIASIYHDFFPLDDVIVGDAHQYLLDHYKEYDFIWASPPCPSHSVTNNFLNAQGVVRYPDMSLWQEIILLQKFCKTMYCIENVKPYYESFLKPQYAGRHAYWCNFYISDFKEKRDFNILNAKGSTRKTNNEYAINLQEHLGFDIEKYSKIDKRKTLRNCVDPKLGLHIYNCAFRDVQLSLLEA